MGAEAEANEHIIANRKVTDGAENNMSIGSDAALKPVGEGKAATGVFSDDKIASTLAAASEKLQATHRRDQKSRRKGVAKCFGAIYPKKFLTKFRDLYINTCMMAAEGEFVDLVGHGGMYYGDNVLSRNISQRRDQEYEEVLQASLSRQVSASLSRQGSQQSRSGTLQMMRNASIGIPGVSRAGSTGITGLHRNASSAMPGLNRQPSTGIAGSNRNTSTGILGFDRHTYIRPSTSGRSPSSRKAKESNLFEAGVRRFLQERASVDLSNRKLRQVDTTQNSKGAGAPEPEITKRGKVEGPVGAAKTSPP